MILLEAPFEIHIIFAIREEYLAALTELEPQLPDLFTNRFRVERMGHAGAVKVIEDPCQVCGIAIEEGLADQILERLGALRTDSVELTYLQVLLEKLYHKAVEIAPDSPQITRDDLDALGTLGDILGEF